MSLESSIVDLTTRATALLDVFSNKAASINVAVAAAIAAVPETSRTWYVDQVNGLDTNAGTAAAPFKTINKAIANTPNFGVCTVQLLGDYNLAETITSTSSNLILVGSGAVRTLAPKYFQEVNASNVTSTFLGGFLLAIQASSIEFRNLNINLPSSAGQSPAPTAIRQTGLVRTNGTGSVPALLGVTFSACAVSAAADFVGALVGSTVSSVSLIGIGSTFPGSFGGKFVMGIASGTLPKDTSNVLTNFSAL